MGQSSTHTHVQYALNTDQIKGSLFQHGWERLKSEEALLVSPCCAEKQNLPVHGEPTSLKMNTNTCVMPLFQCTAVKSSLMQFYSVLVIDVIICPTHSRFLSWKTSHLVQAHHQQKLQNNYGYNSHSDSRTILGLFPTVTPDKVWACLPP